VYHIAHGPSQLPQHLMEGILCNIANVIVCIDDQLVHMKTHEEHLQVLDQVLDWLQTHNLKINLDKCFFGNKEELYLSFTLTPEGIKPGKNKLKTIKNTKQPTNVKTIQSFVGLCNFFWTHIKNFAIIATPLFKLTRKDSGYKGGPLPKEAMDAFYILQNSLVSEPVRAFPPADRQYGLITDTVTGTAKTAGGLGIILTQKDQFDNFYAISYAARQLKDHEKTICHSYLNQRQPSGAWVVFTNTSKARNLSYSRTINHWRKWDISTPK
jgi:hypothetical protein